MKVFYLGVDVSKKKLDLCLRSNGKDILHDIISNDTSSIISWLKMKFEEVLFSEDSLIILPIALKRYHRSVVSGTIIAQRAVPPVSL